MVHLANLSPSQRLRLQKAPQTTNTETTPQHRRRQSAAFFHSCVDRTNTSKLTSRSLTDDSCWECWECWGRLHSGLLARPACGTADLMCRSVTGWGAKDKVQVHADHMTAESLQIFSLEEGGVPLSPNHLFPVGVCRPTPPLQRCLRVCTRCIHSVYIYTHPQKKKTFTQHSHSFPMMPSNLDSIHHQEHPGI